MTEKKQVTRHKLYTIYYDDEGGGNGTVVIDYGNGGTSLPLGPAGSAAMSQQIMQRVPSEDIRCAVAIQVDKFPRDPLVVVAEEKVNEGLHYDTKSGKWLAKP